LIALSNKINIELIKVSHKPIPTDPEDLKSTPISKIYLHNKKEDIDNKPYFGSVASTKFNRFKLIKFKCHKINSIENQHFSFLSDSIFLKKKQKNRQMRQNHNLND